MFGIKNKLRSLKKSFAKKAIILMYHSISEPGIDPWELAVSPLNFEKQLQVLQKIYNVSSVRDIVSRVQRGRLKNKSIALTFDDGYRNNIENAKPLLEKYNVPATFFITNNFGEGKLFWWDRLANLILRTPQLPADFNLTIRGEIFSYSIGEESTINEYLEQLHRKWVAPGTPPTKRSRLFYKLWQLMQPLPPAEIDNLINEIKNWETVNEEVILPGTSLITEDQLRKLSSHHLIDIGLHTANHVALNYHSAFTQETEILQNKKQLEQFLNKEITTIAYPYGEYNNTTLDIVKKIGLQAAFTVEYNVVKHTSDPLKLGRFQVKNWNAREFEENLVEWMKQ
jgi:peptidoglycan/xylan/chitin deacetylase (PgdA/CDA1 family)